MTPAQPGLNGWTLLHVWLRSFAIQASWNFQAMQNLGFLYVIAPGLRKLARSARALRERLSAHFEFFNTHPYMASLALGVTLRAELGGESGSSIQRLKGGVRGPLASWGDQFFWGTWRPLCGLIGVVGVWQGGPLGVWLFLFLFNLPHLVMRSWGLRHGVQEGVEGLRALGRGPWGTIRKVSPQVAAGFLSALGLFWVVGGATSAWGAGWPLLPVTLLFWWGLGRVPAWVLAVWVVGVSLGLAALR